MIEALAAGGLSLVGGWLGAYLGSYLKKKGENLATHEDIGMLVDQVRAVTQTTKEIEAKISSDVWNQQKRWEMKREVLFDAAKQIVELDDALIGLDTLLKMENPDGDQWVQHKHDALMRWREAAKKFDETKLLVAIVCDTETNLEFQNLGVFVSNLANKLANKDAQIYKQSSTELAKKMLRARLAIRKELGIDEGTSLQLAAAKK